MAASNERVVGKPEVSSDEKVAAERRTVARGLRGTTAISGSHVARTTAVSRSRVARTLSVALLLAYGCGTGAGDSGFDHVAPGESAPDQQAVSAGDADATNATESGLAAAPQSAPQAAPPPPNVNVAPALQITCDTAACCPSGKVAVIYSQNADSINSSIANRCVVALGGSDSIMASGTGTAVLAGPGDDIIMAGPGGLVRAADGNDTVNGFSGGVVTGGPGDDTLNSGNGDNYVWPGEGIDSVTLGDGNDKAVIFATCEIFPGDSVSGGAGTDILVTPLPVSQLQAMGMTVSGFETVIIQNNACYSPCVSSRSASTAVGARPARDRATSPASALRGGKAPPVRYLLAMMEMMTTWTEF